jgi:stage II sporulation protein D
MVQKKDGGYLFSGRGWGHGVGLCQWGAKGMAEKGMDYHSILKYYYRDVEVRKIPR